MSKSKDAVGVLNPPPFMAERSVTDQRLNLLFNPFMKKENFSQAGARVERYHSMMADDPANPYSYKIQLPSSQGNCGRR